MHYQVLLMHMENIRKIQIYLGDATTAAVVRSKIAKRKMQEAAA